MQVWVVWHIFFQWSVKACWSGIWKTCLILSSNNILQKIISNVDYHILKNLCVSEAIGPTNWFTFFCPVEFDKESIQYSYLQSFGLQKNVRLLHQSTDVSIQPASLVIYSLMHNINSFHLDWTFPLSFFFFLSAAWLSVNRSQLAQLWLQWISNPPPHNTIKAKPQLSPIPPSAQFSAPSMAILAAKR